MRPNQYYFIIIPFLLSSAIASSNVGYYLETEVRTNYEGQISNNCVWYTYNSSGQRDLVRYFDGSDTTSPLSERVLLAYNSSGTLASETYISNTDTTKRFIYFYNSENKCVSVQKFNSENTISYSDSFYFKDSDVIKRTRFSSNGSISFYNVYTYNNHLLVSDSAFHKDPVNATFTPQEILNYDYTDDKSRAHEIQWTLTGGRYSAKTTTFTYYQNALVSSVKRLGTATSGTFIDSLSYHYDTKGNRIREENFSQQDTITLISSIDYTWKSTGTSLAQQPIKRNNKLTASFVENYIIIKGDEVSKARFRITDVSGRSMLVTRMPTENGVILKPFTFAPGRYFLCAKFENGETIIPLIR